MALRVVLVSAAILPVPQVMAGRMTLSQPEAPEAGNHFSCTENRMINSSPIQKFGMAKPIKENVDADVSHQVFCFTAAIIPNGIDMTMVRITEATARMIV